MFLVAFYRSLCARRSAVDFFFTLPCVLKVLRSSIGLVPRFFFWGGAFIQSLYADVGAAR